MLAQRWEINAEFQIPFSRRLVHSTGKLTNIMRAYRAHYDDYNYYLHVYEARGSGFISLTGDNEVFASGTRARTLQTDRWKFNNK